MKQPLFEFPSYYYEISDWEFKKKALLNRINKSKFIRTEFQHFETDRQTNKKSYVRYFEEFLRPELNQFCTEAGVSCSMTDAWCVRYHKGDYQSTHNHRGWGFSGILYVEFDAEIHRPTMFVAPWQNPRDDCTSLKYPDGIKEGVLFIVPSSTLHFVEPVFSKKRRTVIAFDLLPEIPTHQRINRDDK